jgi:hypothetical protein
MQNFDIRARVNWANVEPQDWAAQIPDTIEKLLSVSDEMNRDRLVIQLANYISHQGGLYETTEVTVPILVDLLRSDLAFGFKWILEVIAGVRCDVATSYVLHGEGNMAQNVYASVYAGRYSYAHFLHHLNPDYRKWASIILSKLVLHVSDSMFLLVERGRIEEDEQVIQSILGGISNLILDSKDSVVSDSVFSIAERFLREKRRVNSRKQQRLAITASILLHSDSQPTYMLDDLRHYLTEFDSDSRYEQISFVTDLTFALPKTPSEFQKQVINLILSNSTNEEVDKILITQM